MSEADVSAGETPPQPLYEVCGPDGSVLARWRDQTMAVLAILEALRIHGQVSVRCEP